MIELIIKKYKYMNCRLPLPENVQEILSPKQEAIHKLIKQK